TAPRGGSDDGLERRRGNAVQAVVLPQRQQSLGLGGQRVYVRAGHGLAPVDTVLVTAGADRAPLGGERRAHHRGQRGVERDGQRPLLDQRGVPRLGLAEAGFGLPGLVI